MSGKKMKKEDIPPKESLMSIEKYIAWINEVLDLDMQNLEDMGSGGAYCALLDMAHPGVINMKLVKVRAKLPEYDRVENLKKFQVGLNEKVGFKKEVDIEELSKLRVRENLAFMQWFYWRFGPKIRVVKALKLSKELKYTKDQEALIAIKALSVKVSQVIAATKKAANTSKSTEGVTLKGWKSGKTLADKAAKAVKITQAKVEEATKASKSVQEKVNVVAESDNYVEVGEAAIAAFDAANEAKKATLQAKNLADKAQNQMVENVKRNSEIEKQIKTARITSHKDVMKADETAKACQKAAKVIEGKLSDVVNAAEAVVSAIKSDEDFTVYEKAVKAAGDKYFIDEQVKITFEAAEKSMKVTDKLLLNIKGVDATPGALWKYSGKIIQKNKTK